jgi:Na+/H+-dicarboxylate symporter
VLALLIALALRRARETEVEGVAVVESVVRAGLTACTTLLSWVVALIPVAVFGVVAHVVAKTGWQLAGDLVAFLGTMIAGLLLHAVVWYSIVLVLVARRSPLRFYRDALDAITTALSCGSSLATLPITMRCLDDMKVSPGNARLATCVGTNLNHDGIILYEAAAAIFVAQAFGFDLDMGQQLTIAFASVLAGIGIAGVPEAGLVTLPLVLGAAGLPAQIVTAVIPTLLPVDWIIGRFRATTNVLSDMTVAVVLDRVTLRPGVHPPPDAR